MIKEIFPDEQLLELSAKLPWFADIANFIAIGVLPPDLNHHQRINYFKMPNSTCGMIPLYLTDVKTKSLKYLWHKKKHEKSRSNATMWHMVGILELHGKHLRY